MRNRYFARNNEDRDVPMLNTSSLPDLIFTVLFFFMIVTHMRDVDLKVHYEVPQGTEIQKLGHKASVVHIYVGRRMNLNDNVNDNLNENVGDDEFFIQLNNDIATLDDIKAFIESERSQMNSEDQGRMTVSIKADRDVPMGLISDIKQTLQQNYALRINYSATERNDNERR
ncbi:MAG: biopolymer transporter ExbD [Prevotella sp.]|nr:biopolymer transporter ExbD [Prevotella sp.]